MPNAAAIIDPGTEATPERRCLVSGEAMPKAGLVRFAVGPDDAVVPDIDERLPGRGLWVTADAGTIAAAGRGAFARAAKRKVSVPDGLPALVEFLLARRLMSLIALARRAGAALAGAEKIAAAPAGLILIARDAGADARRRAGGGNDIMECGLDGDELGAAFDYGRVALVWIAPGGFADSIARECARLGGFRGAPDGAARVE